MNLSINLNLCGEGANLSDVVSTLSLSYYLHATRENMDLKYDKHLHFPLSTLYEFKIACQL